MSGTWATAGGSTLTLGDNINGAAGTDTLKVTVGNSIGASASAAATTVLTGFTTTSVEKVAITATGSWANSSTTFDASTAKDATEFWSDGSGRAVIFGTAGDATQAITKNATIGLKNTTQNVTATFADTLVSGTTDTATVALAGGVGSSAAQPNVILNGVTNTNGFETINVVSTGSANRIAQLDSGTGGNVIQTVNLSGSANVRIDDVDSTAVKTVNASALTGGAGANINVADSTRTDLAFTGSAGADRVVLNNTTANAANTFSLTGGEGKDTIAVGTITNVTTATSLHTTVNKATGFEVFEATATGVTNLQANLFTNINEFVISGTGAVNLAVTGVETADKFTIGANHSGAVATGTAASGTAGTQALTFTGAAPGQTVDLVLSSATAAVAIAGGAGAVGVASAAGANAGAAIGFGGAVSTLKIDSSGSAANSITGGQGGDGVASGGSGAGGVAAVAIDNGTSVQSVVITGSQDLSILGGAAGATISSGGAGGVASVNAFSNSISVDASALQAKLTIAGSAQADSIKVGTKGSEVRATDGADAVTLGAGNDVLVYTNVSQSLTDATNDTTILNSIDKISAWGTGVDKFNVSATTLATGGFTAAEFVAQNVVQAAVNAVSPTSLLQAAQVAATNIGADKIGVFQYGGNTYLLGNDAAAGTLAATDLLVQITGLQTLTADNFVFV